MIVLDASVLIAHADEDDAHHVRAVAALEGVDEAFGASPLTMAEVLVRHAAVGRVETAQGKLTELGVEQVPLGEDAAIRLATLRAETRLKMPDCCVLLAAQQVGGPVLTFDERLAMAAATLGLDAEA